jgi:hypothetical protein
MALANVKKADPFIVVIDLLSPIHPPDLQHAIAEYCTELSVPFPHSSLKEMCIRHKNARCKYNPVR